MKSGEQKETYKRCHNARSVTDRQLQPGCSGPLPIPGAIVWQPGQSQSSDNIQTHCHEEAAEVMYPRARVTDQNPITKNRDGAEDNGIETTHLLPIRKSSHEQISYCSKCIARHGKGLDLGVGPVLVDRLDYGG